MEKEKITQDFFKLLENLNEGDWNIKVNNGWTIKEVISHLVGWEKEAVKVLDEEWKTKKKPWFLETEDFANFNKQSIENYRDYSPKKLMDKWKKWQRLLDEKIDEIGEKNLRKESELFEWVFDEGEDNHYLVHYKQIQQALMNNKL